MITKVDALAALAERREKNKDLKPIDNSRLYAGSPMFFNCLTCNAQISEPENYIPPRRKLCTDCQNLKDLGWLE